MAAVVHFLMRRHLAHVEERQEHVRRRRARRRLSRIFNPTVTLFGISEGAVQKHYRLTPQVIADLIAELRDDLDPSVNLGIAIPVKVLCSLYCLASGSFQTTIGMSGGIAQSTFSREQGIFLDELLKMTDQYISFPKDTHITDVG
ncbi:UNVERIFIED_CONTAM: hypothetical protein FKN15_011906 [Acipenser sinensis]